MIDSDDKLYIGRAWDVHSGETQAEQLRYDPDDLTTHAVVVGMTGSGKTGLCIDMLEEAALQGVPALMIDPKGDITNTLLHFPELLPEDFAPWINPDEARKEGKTIEEAAEQTADLWRNGLAGWDIEGERIQALKDSADFAIYTPGSDAGLPVSIMASLAAPAIPWDDNRELLREQISSTATALLGLIGFNDIDPVTSREHVLLANIFEQAWSQGKSLDLGELIMQIQSPPFEKVGYLQTDAFFPPKERFSLAAKLNNLLASPSFQSWIEGDPLDIANFLYGRDGRPRHTVFYIAHLSEQERMFFVTLLFSAVETWMRGQSGTSSLRSIIYFDEIFGYLPPIGNPPSKEPMLRMLKQARAFGVGLLLATQNPVDVDYKALSNAGTWFIGRLATARDKDRLLDGLTSASGGDLDRKTLSEAISSLGKRVFVLRNVHEKEATLFQTRWAMNYLAGPMTRVQIPALNALAMDEPIAVNINSAGPKSKPQTAAVSTAVNREVPEAESLPGTQTRPPVPRGMGEIFLRPTLSVAEAAEESGRDLASGTAHLGLVYRPALFAQANVLYNARKYDLRHRVQRAFLAPELPAGGIIDWPEFEIEAVDIGRLQEPPAADARFAALDNTLSDGTQLRSLRSDLVDWFYRDAPLIIRANEELGVYVGPDTDETAFREQRQEAADKRLQSDLDKLEATFQRKFKSLETKLQRERRELKEDEAEVARKKQEEYGTYAETLLSLFVGRRRSLSSALSKRGRRSRAEEDVQESIEEIAALEESVADLKGQFEDEIDDLEDEWVRIAEQSEEIPVTPYKKDIDPAFFGVAWLPYYVVRDGEQLIELPAYSLY